MFKFASGILLSIVIISCFSAQPEAQIPVVEKLPIIKEPTDLIRQEYVFKRNASVYKILSDGGYPPSEIAKIVKSAKPVFDLSRIKAGTKYVTGVTGSKELKEIIFHVSNIQRLVLSKTPQSWGTELRELPTTIKLKTYNGEVTDTLWESSERAGMVPYLITALAEVFSWEIDFSREINNGDRWTFTVEQIFAEGKPVGWGEIIIAEYSKLQGTHRAYYYEDREKHIKGHFNDHGKSMRRMFLKSPLKFGRVTSGFSRRRFHPIRKVYRPHLGVDYGAPRGTPVLSIGDGRVIQKGRKGGAGKMLTIRHPGGYKTRYLHLNGYSRGLRVGKKVEQGQVIGYVGSTGLATGAHLHFELFKNGRYQNPLKIKLPSSSAIPSSELSLFNNHIQTLEKKHGRKKSIHL